MWECGCIFGLRVGWIGLVRVGLCIGKMGRIELAGLFIISNLLFVRSEGYVKNSRLFRGGKVEGSNFRKIDDVFYKYKFDFLDSIEF